MQLADRHIVITGAAGGIGSALARRIAQERPRSLTLADLDMDGVEAVARDLDALAVELDAGSEASVRGLVEAATRAGGQIDVFISNAGVGGARGGPEAPEAAWDEAWRVNVMSHVWAARALLPEMLARGEGYLVNTASAAGLLTQVSSLIYSVTKHAAVALAEWMSIEYAERGVRVSCICPQGVRTPMLEMAMEDPVSAAALNFGGLIEPEDVAEAVVEGIAAERMLILPHENVARFMAFRGAEHERWLAGMRKLVAGAREGEPGRPAA